MGSLRQFKARSPFHPEKWYKRVKFFHQDRFWSRVEKTEKCWLWKSTITGEGYGSFYVSIPGAKEAVCLLAHRVAYYLANGKIPEGLFVCHKCDVRNCVNPDHLFLGDHSDNMLDMIQKGRNKGWSKSEIISGVSNDEAEFLMKKYKKQEKTKTPRSTSVYGYL